MSQKLAALCRWQDRTLGVGAGVPGVGALMSVSTLLSPGGPGVAERRAMGGLSARLWAPALWKYLRVRGGQPEGPVSGACGHCGWGLKGN